MSAPDRERRRASLGAIRWKPSLALKFAAFSILVCFLATLLCIVDLMHARNVAVGVARRQAQNITELLVPRACEVFDGADHVLAALAERVERSPSGLADVRRFDSLSTALIATVPGIHDIVLADPTGKVVLSESSMPASRLRTIDVRSSVEYYRNHPGFSVHLAARMTGEPAMPSIVAVRRLDRANGSFAGIAIATIDAAVFKDTFDDIDIGRSGTVALVADDGTIVARRPSLAASMSPRHLEMSSVFGEYVNSMANSIVKRSPIDGVRRLFAFQRLPNYRFSIVVGLTEDEYLAAWRADAVANYAALAFGTALIGTLASGLGVQMTRRRRAEKALAALPVDVLTGLASRRRFDTELEREWRRAAGERAPLGLVIISLANLTTSTEPPGRQEGDEFLMAAARAVTNLTAPGDLAARYSGLELAVILPAADELAARLAADLFRVAIQGLIERLMRAPGATIMVGLGAASVIPGSSAEPAILVAAALTALQDSQVQGSGAEPTSIPDALTGLANRRGFERELEREWYAAVQNRQSVGLIVLELSDLRAYNEFHGHEHGDALLIAVGRAISDIVGPAGLTARYSGLEFAVFLPRSDEAETRAVAERITRALRGIVAQRSGPPATEVALTSGIAQCLPRVTDEPAALIRTALRALRESRAAQLDSR